MRTPLTVRTLAAALALTGALALGACGSDDESTGSAGSGSGAASTAASANAPKGDPIVVGTICDCSGPSSGTQGTTEDVMKAWESATNASGGINGHPVKVVTIDDAGNPSRGLAAAKKLVEQEKVVAIVGQNTTTSGSWETYVSGKGVPVVGGAPVDAAWTTNPDFFASGSTLPMTLYGTVELAAKAGKKKLGLLYCAEAPVCAQTVPIATGLGKLLGVEVQSAKVSTTAPDYAAPCLNLKKSGADALWVAMVSSAVPRVMQSCLKQGYEPFSTTSAATTDAAWLKVAELDGTEISGTNAVYTDESVPGVKAFLDALDEYAPEVREGKNFSAPALYPWAGGELFKAAAEQAKLTPTSTSADVTKGLYALKGATLGGIAPPLTFAKGQPGFSPCYFPAKIEGGEFVSTTKNAPVCLDAAKAKQLQAALAG